MFNHVTSQLNSRLHGVAFKTSAGLASLIVMSILSCSPQAWAQGANSTAVTRVTGSQSSACTDGTSTEDRATCMKEVAAAQAEARRGKLEVKDANYSQNAIQRCMVLPPSDQEACRLRATGQGATSGSVANGGVIREVVVPDTQPQPAGQDYQQPTTQMNDAPR
jgi:hypothetical protein